MAVIEEHELSKNILSPTHATAMPPLPLPAFQSPVYRAMLIMISSRHSAHQWPKNGDRATEEGSRTISSCLNIGKVSMFRCMDHDIRRAASVAIGLLVKELPLRKWFVVGSNLTTAEGSETIQTALNSNSRFSAKSQNQKVKTKCCITKCLK